MSVQATTWVYEHSPYTGVFFSVHLAIADIVNDLYDNRFWLSEEALATKARCSTRTVERAKAQLVKDGYLEVTDGRHGPGKTNEYRFMMPHPQDKWNATDDNMSGVKEITDDNMSGEHPTNATEHPTNATSSLYVNSRELKLTQEITQFNAERGKREKSKNLFEAANEEPSENSRDADTSRETASGEAAKPRKRDLFFDAMAEACGHDLTQLTKSSAAMIAKATSEIRPICKTPDEIWAKAAIYKKLHPDWVLTPSALAKYWSELTQERADSQGSDKYQVHRDFEAEIWAKASQEERAALEKAFGPLVLPDAAQEVGFPTPIPNAAPGRPTAPSPSEHMFDGFCVNDYEDRDIYESDDLGDVDDREVDFDA